MELGPRFNGARSKVEPAIVHIMEAERCLEVFSGSKFHRVVSTYNEGSDCYELGLEVDPLPTNFQSTVGDAIHNLRSALDHVVYEIAPDGRKGFPFHKEREGVERSLSQGSIKSAAPYLIPVILDEIRPYRRGDERMWILNNLDNIDKHRFIISAYSRIELTGVCVECGSNSIVDQSFVKDGPGFLPGFASDMPHKITSSGKAAISVNLVEKSIGLNYLEIPILRTMTALVVNAIQTIDRNVAKFQEA